MISCHRAFLEKRCAERCYSIDEVMSCVSHIDGDTWTIDTNHAAFPRHPKSDCLQANSAGPGTELSKLLKRFGIEPTPTCACRAKAAQMDAWGPDECSKPERIEEVVAVMRAEAEARGLPFLDAVGRLLVKRAIRNARRAASTAENTQS